mmetsp:Transcript_28746/g.56474  ORF Transcript_28746/g.56474 Transcript_28746/m.56474 type:complete len:332 (+) Transcript_28746:63-1058(+)
MSIVFEKEQVNERKQQTSSTLTSGLGALLKKDKATEQKKEGTQKLKPDVVELDGITPVGTGGTSLTLASVTLTADVSVEAPEKPFTCKVFVPQKPGKKSVVVVVTEDISIATFVQTVLVRTANNPEAISSLRVSLYASDSDGEVDEDCPVLDDRRPISQFGITQFVLKSNDDEEFSKVEFNSETVQIGPAVKKHLVDPVARLLHAAEVGNLDEVRSLIQEKLAEVTAKGIDNWTALHFAARQGHLPVVNFLIKQSADIDAVNKNGWSPLHLCCYQGHVEIAETILTCGAEINMKDRQGMTPLAYAKQQNQEEMVSLLEDFLEEEEMYKKGE